MFTEPPSAGTAGLSAHPVDIVLQVFQDPENAPLVVQKCKTFLEEIGRVHGMKMECAQPPVIWLFLHIALSLFFLVVLG